MKTFVGETIDKLIEKVGRKKGGITTAIRLKERNDLLRSGILNATKDDEKEEEEGGRRGGGTGGRKGTWRGTASRVLSRRRGWR